MSALNLTDYLHLTWKQIPKDVVEALAKQRLNDTLAAAGHEPVLDHHWEEVRRKWIYKVESAHGRERQKLNATATKLDAALKRRGMGLGQGAADSKQRARVNKLMSIKRREDAL